MTVAVYTVIAPPDATPSPVLASSLTVPAYAYFSLLGLSLILIIAGCFRYLGQRASREARAGSIPLSPGAIVPHVVSQRRYRDVLVAAALVYGAFYSLLTGIVVFRPDVDFSTLPGLVIPSLQPDKLTGFPLYVPEVTVFLSGHLGLVLIPITIMMMLVVSVLVGVNSALAIFAYDNRTRGLGASWGGQLGAIVGLFTGCPTCAGLYFFSLLGGSGSVSLAVTLGYLQPVSILLSIPVLLATPYLTARSLSKVFREGCIVPANHQRS